MSNIVLWGRWLKHNSEYGNIKDTNELFKSFVSTLSKDECKSLIGMKTQSDKNKKIAVEKLEQERNKQIKINAEMDAYKAYANGCRNRAKNVHELNQQVKKTVDLEKQLVAYKFAVKKIRFMYKEPLPFEITKEMVSLLNENNVNVDDVTNKLNNIPQTLGGLLWFAINNTK